MQVAAVALPDNGYELKLEEDPVDKDEDGDGGSIDEFNHVDIFEGVDGMHDEDIFEAEEARDSWHSSKIIHPAASTVKWTALDPCSSLSESDPKLYTNFEFYEIEFHKHLENI